MADGIVEGQQVEGQQVEGQQVEGQRVEGQRVEGQAGKEIQEEYLEIVADGRRERIPREEAIKRLQMSGAAQRRLEEAEKVLQSAKSARTVDSLLDKVLDDSTPDAEKVKAFQQLLVAKGRNPEEIMQVQQVYGARQQPQPAKAQSQGDNVDTQALVQLAKILKDVKDGQENLREVVSGLDQESLERNREMQRQELFELVAKDQELGKLDRRLGPRSIGGAKEMVWDKYVRIARETQRPGLESMQQALNETRAFYGDIDTPDRVGIPGSIAGFASEGGGSTLKIDGEPKLGKVTDANFEESIQRMIALKALERHRNG